MPKTAPKAPLIEPCVLWFEYLPPALDGLTLLHLTDLHIRGHRDRHDLIIEQLTQQTYDLLLITGDLMNDLGDEPAAHEFMLRVARHAKPRLRTLATLGNHDTTTLRRHLADLPIHWLHDQLWRSDDLPLEIVGLAYTREGERGDLLRAMTDQPHDQTARFRILLAHAPVWLPAAAGAGVDLMISGHTHGGQVRLPGRRAIINKCDWPLKFSSGVLRYKQTRAVVSRGVGESGPCEGLRMFCSPHMPLITLGRGPCAMGDTDHIVVMQPW